MKNDFISVIFLIGNCFLFFYFFRLGEDWNDICSQPELKQSNELQMNDQIHSNIHNIPPLLANAVIKKPQESSIQVCASDENQTIANVNDATNSVSNDSIDHQQQPIESTSSSNDTPFSTMANYLPDRTFFYNEKYSYIFPGAEIWWKDSDLDSNSSNSSNDDDDDDDDDLLKVQRSCSMSNLSKYSIISLSLSLSHCFL